MKFEIMNPVSEVEPVKVKKVVRLGLKLYSNGVVSLVVFDEDQNVFNVLLDILPNGEFKTISGVNPDLGFELGDDGNIIVEKEV